MKLFNNCIGSVVAAAMALGLGLHEVRGAIFFQEDFQSDLPGTVPESATFTQKASVDSVIAVVDASSLLPDPFGGDGNKSLSILDRESSTAGDIRVAFKGDLPDAGLATGTISYKFFGYDDGVALQPPVGSIRAGLNNDLAGNSRINNNEAAFLLTFSATNQFVTQIVILETTSNTTTVLEQTWNFNTSYDIDIHFDALAQTWGATLDGTPLTKPGGSSVFNFWAPVTGINQFDLVGGAGTNRNSTVFFDDILIEGEANAVTASADFNDDGFVDGSDFLIWQRGFGLSDQPNAMTGDATGDGNVDDADLAIWKEQFGMAAGASVQAAAIPEPGTFSLLAAAAAAGMSFRGRRRLSSVNAEAK